MTEVRVLGGHGADGEPCDVVIADGRIAASGAAGPAYDARGLVVLPGLIDLQVNGAAGVDLTSGPERLWEVAAALPAYGVTAFLPTVISSAPGARDRALATLRAGPPDGWAGAVPLGWHFEGPMISPARAGAHPVQWLRPPAAELVAGWNREAGVVMVTIAPELPGALDVIAALVGGGVVVALGHTEATAEQVAAAVAHGARAITHLGNAMPPFSARQPGPIGAALTDPRLVAGVIADGHHLDPVALAALWQALGPERMLSVTDCTAALGMPDGPARLGDRRVVVAGGTVRLADGTLADGTLADGTLAGSAASLPQCLRTLLAATGCPLVEAVATCTSTAADVIGDRERGRIVPGARGDLTLVDPDLRVVATIVGGRLVHDGVKR